MYLLIFSCCSNRSWNRNRPELPEDKGGITLGLTLKAIFFPPCNILLDAQEGEEGEVSLLVESKDTIPIHAVFFLLVQSVEGEERWVETRQQDRKQQSRFTHHSAG